MGIAKKKKKPTAKQTVLKDITFSPDEVFSMMEDTSEIIAQENSTRLSSMGPAASESNTLTDSVEFWSWMNRHWHILSHTGMGASKVSIPKCRWV